MKISWLTDLHLNFVGREQVEGLCHSIIKTNDDAVLITGDLATSISICSHLEYLSARLEQPIFFVLGNHDYYGSSIKCVNSKVQHIVKAHENLVWLSKEKIVELTSESCLIGHEGLADGRLGDPVESNVQLNDYFLIDELKQPSKELRIEVQNKLGDAAAKHLRTRLKEARTKYKHIIVALHVPPFAEACWHLGRNTDDEYLPHFACGATGRVLGNFAIKHPEIKISVYCGHCHSGGHVSILSNLEVFTAAAEYSEPKIERSIIV